MSKESIIITIDGRESNAVKGETILDAARRENVYIPTLCHDPRLKPFSSCFLCVVKVEGMKGLQPSCSTPVSPGMKVSTTGDEIAKARRTALELLLSNHYADCLGPCKLTCPAGVDVQGYISLIQKGLYSEAIRLIKEANPLPAICGRVCVRPCELVCRRSLLEEGKGVGIDYLKRFAADMDMAGEEPYEPVPEPATGKKVALVGAGPAGLSAAWWLALKGHSCHIFEAAPKPGGWLRYGIPEYRLPNDILDKEVKAITDLGVEISCNTKLGKDISWADINNSFDAMILSPGSQLGTRLGCEGDEADGVKPGIDFLREMELSGIRPDLKGQKVIVVGGGNTAMDCCRTAIRCGAVDVKVVYRRSEKEMPANPIEIEESKIEGVEYLFLTNPVKIIANSQGRLQQVRVIRMQLGEPDASGRRRPVEIPGSEYNIDVDLVLAAIGQKSDLSFVGEVNMNTSLGELRLNKWGDIDADPETLQTGVANIFAAGDAVTGPDTIIGAIAQARKASYSCHQYLTGVTIAPRPGIFVSRRDNFRQPGRQDLPQRFSHKSRNEMPLLAPVERINFNEVELGYPDEMIVREEASRCLECGCVAFHDCDLQRYATEYGAEQKKYKGEFLALAPDDTHRFITLDHNKCILCGRCVRICHEIAGADALCFYDRGFKTVAGAGPGMSLNDTMCSSCGLCISTCPTGAITENTDFKPGPVETTSFVTTDFIGSEGASLRLHHRAGFFTAAEGSAGIVNPDASAGHEARFSYRLLNRQRIKKPLLKVNDTFKEISFEEAYDVIRKRLTNDLRDKTAIFAGARLTNEEIFLLKKLAGTIGDKTPVKSFYYTGRDGCSTENAPEVMAPFDTGKCDSFYVIGTDLFIRHQLTGFKIFRQLFSSGSSLTYVTEVVNPGMERKATSVLRIKSYYHFVRAVNCYLLRNEMQNNIFINTGTTGFDDYKKDMLDSDYEMLVRESGVGHDAISSFANEFNNEIRAGLVFAEDDLDLSTINELHNLVLITGKAGKEGSGLYFIRQSCNSQGLADEGCNDNISGTYDPKEYSNIFIFGEDPCGLAYDSGKADELLPGNAFLLVQDFFMTETAKRADIVLPATYAFESGGSFTSSGRVLQFIEKDFESPVLQSGLNQIASLLKVLEETGDNDLHRVHEEMLNDKGNRENGRYRFIITCGPAGKPLFRNGCNTLEDTFFRYIMAR